MPLNKETETEPRIYELSFRVEFSILVLIR